MTSFAQQRLLFLDQLRPGAPDYLLPLALRVRGELDVPALTGAFAAIVARHEVLRTRYTTAGQVVESEVDTTPAWHDLSGTTDAERRAAELVEQELRRPIDLSTAPPLRLTLIRLAAREHLLLFVVHHIAFDGWSWGVLARELAAGYRERTGGPSAVLPQLSLQYADFAAWQRERLTGDRLARLLDFWRTSLSGLTPLELPTDRPRPTVWDGAGDVVRFQLPPELLAQVDAYARNRRATRFMVLLAAFEALLARYTGQTDLAVGTPVAGRTRTEAEPLIGLFANTVVLRGDLSGRPSFATLLDRVRANALAAFSHAEAPFERIVAELAPDRDLSRNPLFQVSFSLRNAVAEPLTLPGLDTELVPTPLLGTPFDLLLDMDIRADGSLAARLQYATALFDQPTVRRLAEGFQQLLRTALSTPDTPVAEIELISAEDHRDLVTKYNDTATALPTGCLHELFAAQVERTPAAVALRGPEGELTFRQLDEHANQIAHHLRARGIGPESLVGVCLPRGFDLVATLLGVLKSGGAYLPLNPADPPDRLAVLLTEAGVSLLVTSAELRPADWTGATTTVPAREGGTGAVAPVQLACPDNAAYVIFTSGSTGRPKGVTITHRNLVNYVSWAASAYSSHTHGSTLYSSVAFDLPVTSLYPALLSGVPVTLTADDGSPGLDALVNTLEHNRFDLLKLTPTHVGVLGQELSPEALRTAAPHVVAGGELLTGALLDPWRRHAPDTVVFNEYGPTETTVGCSVLIRRAGELDPGPLPIGAPIANTTMYVLDAELRPVLPGAVGELYIGGDQVARGYHNQSALTAAKFVPDPFTPGARLYRSGDLVRHRADGELEFVSRTDTQIKIRGFRIEPGEVEAALTAHQDIREAAVVARAGNLVAYLVSTVDIDLSGLRSSLALVLPDHLVPAQYVVLPELPKTASGKVDRKALPDPAAHRLPSGLAHVPPRTPVEHAVAAVWAELLELPEVGVHEDFFTLGGNSLLATRIAARLRAQLDVELPLAEVFTARTVARLAEVITAAEPGRLPITSVPHDGPLPLSFAQQRLWFLDRLAPGATDYLVPFALRLTGELDEPALRAAVRDLADRHAILRTRYLEQDGEPVQLIDPAARIPFTTVTTDGDPLDLVHADLHEPFDLTTQLPARATLIRVGATEHLFLLTLHHICSDGWSAEVLATDLNRLYTARRNGDTPPAPLPVQYADYAAWQRATADTPEFAKRLNHWRNSLADLSTVDLPTDRRRPRVRDWRGDRIAVELPGDLGRAAENLARQHGATPFMVLLAAFQALLSRHGGGQDIPVGTAVAGRGRPELDGLLGFFANTLVLRGNLGGEPTFTDLLTRVRDTALDAYAHADIPFERIVEELAPERDPSRNPLFQVMFELRPDGPAPFTLPGLGVEQVGISWPIAKFDLMLSVLQRADGSLRCGFEYATALFDRSTVERLAAHYGRLLTEVLADPDQPLHGIDFLDTTERTRLTLGWTDSWTQCPAATLPELITEQARRTPDAHAVIFGDTTLTYAELHTRADRLARQLRTLGVRAETAVAVALRRDADLVTAVLAVLKAGGVYVPIDPAHPRQRREHVLTDSGAQVLISQSWIRDDLPDTTIPLLLLDEPGPASSTDPLSTLDPSGAAYVIYTSGSTGRPKGVVISHEAIRNRVLWTIREHGLGPADRVLQKTTVSFDASMWEFLAPLVAGGTVVVAADGVPRDPAAMVAAMVEHRVTVLQLVPSVLRVLLQQPDLADCAALRLVFCAGEPLPADLCADLLRQVPVRLTNTYGPTECAIDVTAWEYTGAEPNEIVAIGRPLDNTRILVLDQHNQLAPIGVPGELCVAGVNLARGYLGRGDLTAARFTPNPFPAEPGERLYRTGDLARRRADGVLEYLGRLDRQVKLRGVRIEPGEIEIALCEHPAITAAAVEVYAVGEDQRLVAHLVTNTEVDPAELRAHLAERLPEAMIPAVLRTLDALPLTASGKIDRAALPGLNGLDTDADYIEPRTPAEATVAALFAELLGTTRVGATDDFFAMGGHSLLATRLVFRLRKAFGVEVPVAEVFAGRTVESLAHLVSTSDRKAEVITRIPRDGELPPSSAQRRMWFLDQLEPGSAEYLVPLVLRLHGPLDLPAFAGALDDVVARHEILRTRYPAPAGEPIQVIDPPASLDAHPIDLTALPYQEAVAQAETLVHADTARPFALDREIPFRALLIRIRPEEHLIALTAHHIAVDAWSIDVLTRDLGRYYESRTAGATPPPDPAIQYADFAAWQTHWSTGPDPERHLAYWRDRLAHLPQLELPADHPRPSTRDSRGDLLTIEVPADTTAAVDALARTHGTTPFMVLLAAFQLLLARHTGSPDVAVGTPVAGRTRAETEDLLGAFLNTVVLRESLDGVPSFAALLGQVRGHVVDAFAHQDLPFERLVDELQPGRDLSRNPLFQVMFELQQAQRTPLRLPGLTVERVQTPWHTAKFDLTLSLGRRADGSLTGLFEYATALFDRSTIDRMAGHYLRLLHHAVTRPELPLDALAMLTEPERAQLLHEWNPPAAPETAACVPALFEQRVAAHPDAEAVTFGPDRLSYAELNTRANRLAHHLRDRGVGPEKIVAVCLDRGLDAVISLLAVLKAGGAYVPVDPDHPADRLAFMLEDATAHLVIATGDRPVATDRPVVRLDREAEAIAQCPAHNPEPLATPAHLAYMIFTSGSTGRPKGVLIEHGSYAHHCRIIAREYDIRPTDRVVLLSALTFDVAMDQIAATLLVGATIVVADPLFWSPAELPDRIHEHGITIMEITPAYYREVLRGLRPGDPRLRGLRLMNVGSDVVTVDDARRWAGTGLPGRFLCNYGPTEATVTCLLHPIGDLPAGARAEAALPIGRPVPGTRAYVVDRHGDPVPVGVPGELLLGGVRLARGYHRRPGLTAEKFVPDPFGVEPGARLYRTGDLVRYLADGTIEFLGRIDQQVKLRGFRIELGEIEAVLAQHPAVRAAVVLAREVRPGDRRLVAYLVPQDRTPEITDLRAFAGERLPEYMVPGLWTFLPELPLTPSKKVDRKALPQPEIDRPDLEIPYQAPRTPTEDIVAGIWGEVLGLDRIGVEDDVFALGAHSLLATRVLARLNAVFGIDLPLRRLFEATTVATVAAAVHTAIEAEIDQLSDEEVAALLEPGER
ncbi:amino acid adenylation domain-containing protein [Crossiella sp. SN42]|uniref:non-ribosomal peptide synthetase n=1 Tax=Crossiella sp. SN42 TaxID=2944808 RepID=UPI00207D0B90|nr:non-ribosomal peptide synthetase [Crossiella sp. SN42]MCO1578421.1 amino acid adenylation domain-containing protein [Crossiella sp. SN42]